jgi:hypothetical protein
MDRAFTASQIRPARRRRTESNHDGLTYRKVFTGEFRRQCLGFSIQEAY